MADRFYGTVYIGGRINLLQQRTLEQLLEPLKEFEDQRLEDGWRFQDCVSSDFEPLRDYCISQDIPLAISWDAKWEFGACIEYYIRGEKRQFNCSPEEEIVVTEQYLRARQHMSGKEILDELAIPDFPDLELEEEVVSP